MAYILNSPTFNGTVTSNGPISIAASQGVVLASGAPGVTTNTLYQVGGSLYWNGSAVGGGSNPMTTLGDTIYGGAAGASTRLPGNITTTKQFLTQTGNGSISAIPIWGTITSSDIATALSSGVTSSVYVITGAAATLRDFQFQTSGVNRWIFRVDTAAESGSDAGSNLQIIARSDTGTIIDNVVNILRAANGYIAFSATRPITGFSLSLSSTTASTLPTNGALNVAGGVGIGGALNVGGLVNVTLQTYLQAPQTGTIIHCVQVDTSSAFITLDTFGSSANAAFLGRRTQGTKGSPTAVSVGNILAFFGGSGYDGANYSNAARGFFAIRVSETWNASAQGTYATISTTPVGTISALVCATFTDTLTTLTTALTTSGITTIAIQPYLQVPQTGTTLHIIQADTTHNVICLDTFGNVNAGIIGRKVQGAKGTPTPPINGNILVYLGGTGYDGANYSNAARGLFAVRSGETWSSSAQGAYVTISLTPNGTLSTAVYVTITDTLTTLNTGLTASGLVTFTNTITDPSTISYGSYCNSTLTLTAISSGSAVACGSLLTYSGSYNTTGLLIGALFKSENTSASTVGWIVGINAVAKHSGAGTTSNLCGLLINTNKTAGTVTNAYGISISDVTYGSSTNYAIYAGLGIVKFTDTTVSTSTTSGALIVSGGVGIADDTYIGGDLHLTSGTASVSYSTGALVITGDIGITGNINMYGIFQSSPSIYPAVSTAGNSMYSNVFNNSADNALNVTGFTSALAINSGYSNSGTLTGIAAQAINQTTLAGAIAANVVAFSAEAKQNGTGTVTNLVAMSAIFTKSSAGAITNCYGLKIDSGKASTFNYGLYIVAQVGAATNYAIYVEGGIVRISDLTSSTAYTNGALVVSGGVGIGGNTNISGTLYSTSFLIDPPTAITAYGISSISTLTLTNGTNNKNVYASYSSLIYGNSYGMAGGGLNGGGFKVENNAVSGTIPSVVGLSSELKHSGAGTTVNAMGIFVNITKLAGSITNCYGLRIVGAGIGSTLNYGLYIAAQSSATTNYAIYANAGITYLGDTTVSSSYSNGSLVVLGGVGIAGNLNINGALSIGSSKGITIPTGAPGVTTDTLYSLSGNLYFNGVQLASGGASSNTGSTIVDFGTTKKSDCSVTITGQAAIASSSILKAWITAKDSIDHSIEEHWIEDLEIISGNIIAGTGFTIYAKCASLTTGKYNVQWEWK